MNRSGDQGQYDPAVRDFYQRYPYPPPVEDLERYRLLWQDPGKRRADFHLFRPDQPFREDGTILVAGCGTSQAAKHALRWPRCRVVGIDFSETSVRHTQALKQRHRIDNLQVHQLPIERVGELGECFNQVVCTGVLHHLEDPEAGLAALHSVLEPDGVAHLMVYAAYGRTGIYMLQEFSRLLGIDATDEGIRELIQALAILPATHPLQPLLQGALDFRDPGAIADALLNPRDRAYTVPQLLQFLDRGGFTLARWTSQAPYSARCGIMTGLPHANRLQSLPLADQYSAAELFRGNIATHSVVAVRSDRPGGARQPDFSRDGWQRYIPLRIPGTIRVRERLPPGAAAVLINRSHPWRDLVLAIDSVEDALLTAVDGQRDIAAIMALVQPAPTGGTDLETAARGFFETLYWWDQIVVDASQAWATRVYAREPGEHASTRGSQT